MGILGIGRQQGFIGEDIDPSGQSLGCLEHHFVGFAAECLTAPVTRRPQTMLHVTTDLICAERFEFEAMGDTFAQLANLRYRQILIQFRLAE